VVPGDCDLCPIGPSGVLSSPCSSSTDSELALIRSGDDLCIPLMCADCGGRFSETRGAFWHRFWCERFVGLLGGARKKKKKAGNNVSAGGAAMPDRRDGGFGYSNSIQVSPFPPRLRRTLKYCENLVFAATGIGTGDYQFAINAAYDVDYTGSGHQPRFFDQLCSSTGPYTLYRVLKARVSLECVNQAPGVSWVMCGGFSAQSAIPGANVPINGELPGWKTWALTAEQGVPARKNFSASIAQIAGVPPSRVLDAPEFAALYNARPTNLCYFNVQFGNSAGSAQNVGVIVNIELDVQFEEPLPVATS